MKWFREVAIYGVLIIAVILLRMFVITPVCVDGNSMLPTLKNGEILLLKKYDKSIERFDIVVLNYNGQKLVKRVIGLPGETILYKDNKLYINNEEIKDVQTGYRTSDFSYVVGEDAYFVLGDNRVDSLDSRIFGEVSKDNIDGVTSFAIFPFSSFGSIPCKR